MLPRPGTVSGADRARAERIGPGIAPPSPRRPARPERTPE